ncbi:hypothetical protein SAMN05216387_11267 [Nitrosovibrio tenuis]|uniref:Uncharacterized protein n=1 Tax=Nitrosovibrio tenuis TaxID=1233 RepID=A0A1H7QLW2_9PROT|nr:hypothetical protein SAMN05216387_11267 [Nitrosovibrio tenuis]
MVSLFASVEGSILLLIKYVINNNDLADQLDVSTNL